MKLPLTEPFKIKMVENIYRSTREQRVCGIKVAAFKVGNVRAGRVVVDAG
jgi:tyrosine phenol-lyase